MDVLSRTVRIHIESMKHIDNIEDIKQRSGGQNIEGLEELLCDVTKNKDDTKQIIEDIDELLVLNSEKQARLKEKIRSLEENESYYPRKIAEHEREIFKQDERIKKLEENVQGLGTQLTITQTNLKETQNDLTETKYDLAVTQTDLTETKHGLAATQNRLREALNDHEQTKTKLKEIESTLHTGQIAFDFEKDLATYIYPHDKKFGSRKVFTNMKKWLEDKKDTVQGREASEKWDSLKDEFSWSIEHERVFFKLLEFRKKGAHPEVDRDAIQSQIPEDFNDKEKKCIKDIINITERVNELML